MGMAANKLAIRGKAMQAGTKDRNTAAKQGEQDKQER